jgi:hypothetical protein
MNTQNNPDPDSNPDSNPDPANDNNNGAAMTPVPKASALASTALTAMIAAFKTVDTPISSYSLHPLMQFKSREKGIWAFGQRKTIPDPGSLWAVNPHPVFSMKWGWICWGDSSKPLGEKLVPITEPLPDFATLRNLGFPWQEARAASMKCVSGVDAGTEVVFKTNTVGGKQEIDRLIDEVRNRINNGQHDGKVVPVVRLENSSYSHPQFGKTYVPVMTIADWMPLDGPAPAPEPASPPSSSPSSTTEQPRRRRVV